MSFETFDSKLRFSESNRSVADLFCKDFKENIFQILRDIESFSTFFQLSESQLSKAVSVLSLPQFLDFDDIQGLHYDSKSVFEHFRWVSDQTEKESNHLELLSGLAQVDLRVNSIINDKHIDEDLTVVKNLLTESRDLEGFHSWHKQFDIELKNLSNTISGISESAATSKDLTSLKEEIINPVSEEIKKALTQTSYERGRNFPSRQTRDVFKLDDSCTTIDIHSDLVKFLETKRIRLSEENIGDLLIFVNNCFVGFENRRYNNSYKSYSNRAFMLKKRSKIELFLGAQIIKRGWSSSDIVKIFKKEFNDCNTAGNVIYEHIRKSKSKK
ncbi:hypothetical protein GCM10011325_08510 [Dyadobacter sediminis]|nr:hypothetical protein GCM10011325_08510 [Dyadobacter sediminis]